MSTAREKEVYKEVNRIVLSVESTFNIKTEKAMLEAILTELVRIRMKLEEPEAI